jgi:hypothetical protein
MSLPFWRSCVVPGVCDVPRRIAVREDHGLQAHRAGVPRDGRKIGKLVDNFVMTYRHEPAFFALQRVVYAKSAAAPVAALGQILRPHAIAEM